MVKKTLPESFGRKKKQTLKYMYDNVGKKVSGWKNQFFTPEILLKDVAQAMLVFTMSVFELPVALCSGIDIYYLNFGCDLIIGGVKCHGYHGIK